jgi:hypothetical protein
MHSIFQLWSARDYKPIKSLVGHESKVTSLDISGGEILLMDFFVPVYIQKPSGAVINSALHLILKIKMGLFIIGIFMSDPSLAFYFLVS